MSWKIYRFTAVLSCLALIAGCGGGGSGGGTPPAIPTVVKENVSFLDAGGISTIASTADTVTVSGAAEGIAPGTVVMSGKGEGLLRRVVSRSSMSSNTVLRTEAATLDDVYVSIDTSRKAQIGAGDFAQFTPQPGVELVSRSGGDRAQQGEIELRLTKFELEDQAGKKITVSGTLSLSLDLDIAFRKQSGEWHARAVFELKGKADATLQASLTASLQKKQIISSIRLKPFLLPGGGVPIVVVPFIEVYTVAGGEFKAGATLTASVECAAKVGAVLEGGKWNVVKGLTHSQGVSISPNLYTSASYAYTPARTEISLLMYGSAGAYAAMDSPKYSVSLTRQANPAGLRVKAGGAYEASAGMKFKVLKTSILDIEFPGALKTEFSIYDRFYGDDGGVSVGVR